MSAAPPGLGRLLYAGIEGTRLEGAARSLLERVRPGAVVLFARNVESPAGLKDLVREIKLVDPGILVAIDQEGGPVDRLRPHIPSLPSALALGRTGERELSRRAGRLTGEALSLAGIDLDFAPVCDLAIAGVDNAIGIRSFGAEPDPVAAMAGSFLAGLEARGVVGCLKHFPGLGLATADSHQTLPVIPASRADLLAGEIAVFSQLLGGAAAVMVSHGYYPHLTHRGAFPATLSDEVVTGLLKTELGFAGAALTDDMVMGALAAEEIGEAAVRALEAGADGLLVCEDEAKVARVADAIARAAAAGRLGAARLADAGARQERLREHVERRRRAEQERVARRPESAEARWKSLMDEMRRLAREVAEKSVLRTRRGGRLLGSGPAVVLRPRVKWLSLECSRPEGSPFLLGLAESGIEAREVLYDSETIAEELKPLLSAPSPPAAYLLATYDAQRRPAVRDAARRLAARAPVFHIALGWPDDLGEAPLRAAVSTLGCGFEAVHFGVRVLTGQARTQARPMA